MINDYKLSLNAFWLPVNIGAIGIRFVDLLEYDCITISGRNEWPDLGVRIGNRE